MTHKKYTIKTFCAPTGDEVDEMIKDYCENEQVFERKDLRVEYSKYSQPTQVCVTSHFLPIEKVLITSSDLTDDDLPGIGEDYHLSKPFKFLLGAVFLTFIIFITILILIMTVIILPFDWAFKKVFGEPKPYDYED